MHNVATAIDEELAQIIKENGLEKEWAKINEAIVKATSLDEYFKCDLNQLVETHLANCLRPKLKVIYFKDGQGQENVQLFEETEDGFYVFMSSYAVVNNKVSIDAIHKVKELAYRGYLIQQDKEWTCENIALGETL